MNWFNPLFKKSNHDDTYNGPLLTMEYEYLMYKIPLLREAAKNKEAMDVLPRWREEVCRKIFLLPNEEILQGLSLIQLKAIKKEVNEIEGTVKKYSLSRYKEIHANSNS